MIVFLPDNSTSNMLWGRLGHIQRSQDRQASDAESSHPPAHDNANPLTAVNRKLYSKADDEDQAPERDAGPTSKLIR
jgi:hypothetical protein